MFKLSLWLKEWVTMSILFYTLGFNKVIRKEKNIFKQFANLEIIIFTHIYSNISDFELTEMTLW